ncbi:hypothetical protein HDV03_005249 [Kappamyces sp. JEL0829]|nr:hypothetical protein HDV03_005249 [Kappamyces sp. JEL0829]
MDDAALFQWVSDMVIKVTGFSEDTIVDFIIACAKGSKSSQDLLRVLQRDAQLPKSDQVERFVNELYLKIPRKQSKKIDKTLEAKKLLERNTSYKMLPDEEPALDIAPPTKKGKREDYGEPVSDRAKSSEKRSREGQEAVVIKGKKIRKIDRSSKASAWDVLDAEEDFASENEAQDADYDSERERDLRERDEFAQRLRDKDLEKELLKQDKKLDEKTKQRLKLAQDREARKELMPSLRERSRFEYLKKREDEKLLLLEKEIEDEEAYFRDEKLTRREIEELEKKKTVLRLAKERQALDQEQPEAYRMPEDYITEKGKLDKKKQDAALYARYQDTKSTEKFVSEQDEWEQRQSQYTKGLLKDTADETEFDYVFDESHQVQFVLNTAGTEAIVDHGPKVSERERKGMPSPALTAATSIMEIRKSLPIYAFREQLLDAIDNFQTLIVVGETGSGKTTQIAQYLMESGYTQNGKKIGCTQPRRVAAMSVAARVAEERGTRLGTEVGYSIRFEDCTSEKTQLKYMTDGMLLREFLTEPDLQSYSCLIIDEAHERSLHTDILFGLVKDIARFRPDLKLLISSATMDAEKFSEYFDDAPIFNIPGRKFPVEVYHTAAPEGNYLAAAITTIMTIHITQPPGDILLFLTGQDEIEQVQENLMQICKSLGSKIGEMIICPIYANLPSEMQGKIFEPTPHGARKVVLSTNIAETSITIDGVIYVIDPGFCKQNNYNPRTGMESLVVVPTSRASANQRKGRAGRVSAGKCFRLYTAWAYQNELEENTVPEIQRTNMTSTVLLLKSLGINDLMSFDFMDAPPAETLIRALEQLYALGALNDRGELTKLGRRMAEFPTEPMQSKSIIAAEKYKCTEEVASIIAMLSGGGNSVFHLPKDKIKHAEQARRNFFRPGGDQLTLLAIWNAWAETGFSTQWCYENFIQYRTMNRVRAVRDQLLGLMERTEVPLISNADPANTVPIRKALTAGFFYHSARMSRGGDSYRTIKNNLTVSIHPSSSLFGEVPKWVLYYELVLTSKE